MFCPEVSRSTGRASCPPRSPDLNANRYYFSPFAPRLPLPASLCEPNPHRFGMRRKPFEFRETDNRFCVPVESGSRIGDYTGLFQEIIHPQRGSEPGGAGSGEHVIWAGKVVSDRLRSVVPNKDGARVFDPAVAREADLADAVRGVRALSDLQARKQHPGSLR